MFVNFSRSMILVYVFFIMIVELIFIESYIEILLGIIRVNCLFYEIIMVKVIVFG